MPNLTFKLDDNSNTGERIIKDFKYKWKFLNVIVENKSRPWWQSWLFGNVPAENARVWISFFDYDSNSRLFRISGRWASTAQPISTLGQPDWSSILVTSRESIPIDEAASVAVAIKTENPKKDSNVYAFNNESYMYYPGYPSPYDALWTKPEFLIGEDKKYRVCIEILSNGHMYHGEFTLSNSDKFYNNIKLLQKEQFNC